MLRLRLPILALPLALLVALLAGATTALAADPPNILFIFSDDHAYQSIGAYGSKINQTPNIDRLAREGMRFDRCYVTNSICGPSRATILTGKYSHLNGFIQNESGDFDGSQQTFPKLLQKKGYQTAVIGKWHLGSEPTGFDHWNVLIGQGTYYNPRMIENGKKVSYTGYTTDIITDLALDWLKSRDQGKPFLLMYQHKAPHREWAPALRHLTKYDDVTMPEPATLFDDYSGRGTPAKTQDMTIAKTMNEHDLKLVPRQYPLTPEQRKAWDAAYGPKNEAFKEANLQGKDLVRWKYQRYIKDYLRCVDAVDENIGRVLDYLDQAGLADNTIVVYSSDQGFYLGEHGWFDKRWMYEESLRTPLVVRWPGKVKPGSVNGEAIVSNLDFAETFLEAAGVEVPSAMQGRSLVPILQGNTPDDWRDAFYYHYYEFPGWHSVRRHYGVTDGRYKLIHFYEPDVDEWELYDLQKDPNEMQSVYGDPAYAEVQKRMHDKLAELRRELKVPEDHPQK